MLTSLLSLKRASTDPETKVELKVIGAGFGRTGTSSLKEALEMLGFGPCHHMSELPGRMSRCKAYIAAYQGKPTDWKKMMAGWGSTVDHPNSDFVPELMKAYPDAKVILTVRDSTAAWYQSFTSTIMRMHPWWNGLIIYSIPPIYIFWSVAQAVHEYHKRMFGSYTPYEEHNKQIKEIVPDEKLLVFNVKEGWTPLCKFLEVEVPNVPFPRSNETEEMHKRFRMMWIMGTTAWIVELGLLALVVRQVMKAGWLQHIDLRSLIPA